MDRHKDSGRSSETDWIPDALPASTDLPPKPDTESGRQRRQYKRGNPRESKPPESIWQKK